MPAFRLATPKSEEVPAGDLRIAVADTRLDPETCAVVVNGKRLRLGTPGLRWDGIRGEFVVNLTAAGFRFRDGERGEPASHGAGAGPALAGLAGCAWARICAAHCAGGSHPRGPDRVDTFEQDVGSWRRLGGEQGGRPGAMRLQRPPWSLQPSDSLIAVWPSSARPCARSRSMRRWPRLTFWAPRPS